MIKKLFIVLAFGLFFNFGIIPARATESVVDQACLSQRPGYYGISLEEGPAAQIFTPTKNTLDSVLLELYSNTGQAKARIRVYGFTDPNTPVMIAEKYIWVGSLGDDYINVDFTDAPMPSGIYILTVEMLSQDHPVYLIATDGDCYPGGYAFAEGSSRNNIDMVFGIKGYDSVPQQESSSNDQSPAAPEPSAPEPASTSSQTSSTTASSTTVNSSTSIGTVNSSSAIQPIDPSAVVKKEIPGDKSNINKESSYSQKLASDKELQETIAFVLSDITKNRYTDGAFGLSGRVGRFLTWPVFYGICGLILLIILIVIIRLVKKNKALNIVVKNENKNPPDKVADKPLESHVSPSRTTVKKTAVVAPRKRKNIGLILFILILLALSGYQSYRTYYAPYTDEKNKEKEVAVNSETAAPGAEAPSSNSTTASKQATGSGTTQQSNTASSSTAPVPVNNSAEELKSKTIEYFIDIALAYQGVERWPSDFNVGYGPGVLDNNLETCLDGFIRDFNNASSTAKLHKNREDPDIKIYVVSPEEMVQYGGEDAGRGFAFIYKNGNNEDYKGEIFLRNQLPDDQKAKCYLIKHELMHTVGFHGHSDLFWEGIMAVPSTNRNTENLMSEVDTKAIQMLYSIGLPLKSNEEETRAYLNVHYPN